MVVRLVVEVASGRHFSTSRDLTTFSSHVLVAAVVVMVTVPTGVVVVVIMPRAQVVVLRVAAAWVARTITRVVQSHLVQLQLVRRHSAILVAPVVLLQVPTAMVVVVVMVVVVLVVVLLVVAVVVIS
jgi:hypothetical protein